MPFNFRLNVQQVFRRLGIQTGALLPQLDDNVQMTMLITDLSRLVPAPVEPRGLAGININPLPPLFSVCQLRSLAAGGIFVESVVFRGAAFPPDENYLIGVNDTDLGLPLSTGHINVGGEPVLSRFTSGRKAIAPGGSPIPAGEGQETVSFSPGIFVPNQAFFSVSTTTADTRLDVSIIYRELPSIEEVG